jgi:hypothetical protein
MAEKREASKVPQQAHRERRGLARGRAAPSALRITIRCLPGAVAPAIQRLQRTVVHASTLARPPTADPQRR